MSEHLAKERKETDALKAEALRLGIDIPWNKGWWWEDVDNFGGSPDTWEFLREDFQYLTDKGKAGARKLIRDELRRLEIEARKDIEWERQATQWRLTKWGIVIGWILALVAIAINFLKRP